MPTRTLPNRLHLRVVLFTLAFGLLGGLAQDLKASHLVGGDLGYQYLGETVPGSGMYRYKLKMRMYLNCGPSSNWPEMQLWLVQYDPAARAAAPLVERAIKLAAEA